MQNGKRARSILNIGAVILSLLLGVVVISVEIRPISLENFTVAVTDLTRIVSAGLLVVLIVLVPGFHIHGREQPDEHLADRQLKSWQRGILFPLAFAVVLTVVVDPRSRIGFSPFAPVTVSARTVKTKFYDALPATPDLVILGSSHAFTLSPAYIYRRLGYRAFNWSVEASTSEDNLILSNYLLARHDRILPPVLLVEIAPLLGIGPQITAERAPVEWLPYMSPSMAYLTLHQLVNSTFSIQAPAESAYVLVKYIVRGSRSTEMWSFSGDGLGTRPSEPYMEGALYQDIRNRPPAMCTQLDNGAMQIVEALVENAESHGSAVVFFTSPMHADYYAAFQNDALFLQCLTALNNYMDILTARHANTFYLDYIQLEAVISLGADGFYDAQHLTPLASEKLIDAAADTIRTAHGWAESHRKP